MIHKLLLVETTSLMATTRTEATCGPTYSMARAIGATAWQKGLSVDAIIWVATHSAHHMDRPHQQPQQWGMGAITCHKDGKSASSVHVFSVYRKIWWALNLVPRCLSTSTIYTYKLLVSYRPHVLPTEQLCKDFFLSGRDVDRTNEGINHVLGDSCMINSQWLYPPEEREIQGVRVANLILIKV